MKWIHLLSAAELLDGAPMASEPAPGARSLRARATRSRRRTPACATHRRGRLPPGPALPQAKLMELLRVGRTPLRNALSRLQNDGLVIATPNHGYAVAPVPLLVGRGDLHAAARGRAAAARGARPAISDGALERMRELLRRMEECLDEPRPSSARTASTTWSSARRSRARSSTSS